MPGIHIQMPNIPKEMLEPELLLVLYAVDKAPNGVPTKTHFQNMMYVVLKATDNDPRSAAGYVPHHLGPYSPVVESWRDTLIDSGYLEKGSGEKVRIHPDVRVDVGGITFDDELLELKITNVVRFVCSLDYDELILYIHTDDVLKKEDMTVNSDVRDDVFARRVPIAMGMVRSGKVTMAKGAELADLDVGSFMELMGERNRA